jgi:transcription initiation factor TFIID TATA-box-binding protein
VVQNIRVENIVASAALGTTLQLERVALGLEDAEYEPKQFPGVVYRTRSPKTAILLFRSGKLVCTGAKRMDDVSAAITHLVDRIRANGVDVPVPDISVQNIVASSDLGAELNLNAVALSLGLDRIEYEPEQFPCVVYRMENPKVVVLIFSSGKVVCTGAKSPLDVDSALQILHRELTAIGML